MSQNPDDDFNWYYQHSESSIDLPHGGYILADSSEQERNDQAIIMTPELTFLGAQCLIFRCVTVISQIST